MFFRTSLNQKKYAYSYVSIIGTAQSLPDKMGTETWNRFSRILERFIFTSLCCYHNHPGFVSRFSQNLQNHTSSQDSLRRRSLTGNLAGVLSFMSIRNWSPVLYTARKCRASNIASILGALQFYDKEMTYIFTQSPPTSARQKYFTISGVDVSLVLSKRFVETLFFSFSISVRILVDQAVVASW